MCCPQFTYSDDDDLLNLKSDVEPRCPTRHIKPLVLVCSGKVAGRVPAKSSPYHVLCSIFWIHRGQVRASSENHPAQYHTQDPETMAIPSSSLTSIGEVPYYVPATRLVAPTRQIWSSSAPNPVSDLVPSSIFLLDKAAQQRSGCLVAFLKGTMASWLAKDDVFTVEFLRRLYLVASDAEKTTGIFEGHGSKNDLDKLLFRWGTSSINLVDAASIAEGDLTQLWRPGPYFACATTGTIRPAWELFMDVNEAFMFPVVPTEQNSERHICASIDIDVHRRI